MMACRHMCVCTLLDVQKGSIRCLAALAVRQNPGLTCQQSSCAAPDQENLGDGHLELLLRVCKGRNSRHIRSQQQYPKVRHAELCFAAAPGGGSVRNV